MRFLYTLTIFLGSLLLFAIQPMIAKMILPSFGGTPAVWNTSMVFFQAALLFGYAYAHYGQRILGQRVHGIVHVVLMLGALVTLPFGVAATFNPSKMNMAPEWVLLLFLISAVGMPYFLVSSGAPLLQRWFSRSGDSSAKNPYFLYAASNLGSLIALLGYPFLLEGAFDLTTQSKFWQIGFMVLIGLVGACALTMRKGDVQSQKTDPADPPSGGQRLRWVFLGAVPSSLLLGITTHLTTNVASVPLLWVVPLSVYLLTFIIAFAGRTKLGSEKIGRWAALLIAPMCLILVLEANEPFVIISCFHLIIFFLIALMAHRELAETAPDADHLTEFYLLISLGGVIGGVFNAMVAPSVFTTVLEYPLALIAAMVLRWRPGQETLNAKDLMAVGGVMALALGTILTARALHMPPSTARTAVTLGIPALAAFFTLERPLRYALAVGGYLGVAFFMGAGSGGGVIYAKRSFFGIHRIMEYGGFRSLVHGTTIHGRQLLDSPQKPVPTTYYHATGPIGVVIQDLQKIQPTNSVGIVGLGVGSLAAYGRQGDDYTIFEIDPEVIAIAQNAKWFRFLSTSEASLHIIEGDARLSMRDIPDGKFDILAVDAFSSDAIPMHLITLEAIQLYLDKIKPNGALMMHISNRYLDLTQILVGACQELKVPGGTFRDLAIDDEQKLQGKTPSEWFIIAKTSAALDNYRKDGRWLWLDELKSKPAWTDKRSNLLEVWNAEGSDL